MLADRLRITRGEATRRIAEAADLGPRRALTGEPLQARLVATAAAQRRGQIGASHVAVIRRFLEELPGWVDAPTREQAEADLAKVATEHRPETVRKVADRIACYLNPDGQYSDEDRDQRRASRPWASRPQRHVQTQWVVDPADPGGPGSRLGQTGRTRHG